MITVAFGGKCALSQSRYHNSELERIEDTLECLESLQKITYPDYEVIVVDNGSLGDDVKVLRENFGAYAHIVENDKNYGFAGGSNIGIRHALNAFAPAYLLLLNNDMVVAPDFLDELVSVAEREVEVGIVGPKVYYYDFQGRSDVIWCAGGKIRWRSRYGYCHIGINQDDLPQYQNIGSVDWVSGAAMMIKRRVIEELSLFDPGYFFGSEDVEYCIRARKHCFKIMYVPGARVWHKVGKSRKRYASGSAYLFHHILNHYRFVLRNSPAPVCAYHLLMSPIFISGVLRSYWNRHGNKAS